MKSKGQKSISHFLTIDGTQPLHLSLFNSFFFSKTTNPIREGAPGCWITIHDTGGEKAATLTDEDRRGQALQ